MAQHIDEMRAKFKLLLTNGSGSENEIRNAAQAYSDAILQTLRKYDDDGNHIFYIIEIPIIGEPIIIEETMTSIIQRSKEEGFTDDTIKKAIISARNEYPGINKMMYIKRC